MTQHAGEKFSKVGKINFPNIIKIVSKHLAVMLQEQMKMAQAMETGNLRMKITNHVSGSTKICQSEGSCFPAV